MTRAAPEKLWWTADELAASGLPELPGTRQGINAMANERGWRIQPECVRRKAGRGGGWQYHWSVLPDRTRSALLMATAPNPDAKPDRGAAWAAFDGLPDAVKETARNRLSILQAVEMVRAAGATKVVAVNAAIEGTPYSARTVFDWFKMIEGVAVEDRLAYLPPKHRLANRTKEKATDAREFLDHIKTLYLRLEPATFRQSYRIAIGLAKAEGWDTLTERTAKRRIEAEVPHVTRVYMREGPVGLMRCYPAQKRDRTCLYAMEAANADCHKIDVFVIWPDGTIDRPQIAAFQDLYSGKILSWCVDHDPNKAMVMAAFGEMVEQYGIPRRCLFDNGKEFANKWLTGGAKHRFRYKICEDDALGVLPLLGIEMTFATPAHGQAKPIERGFRDFANDIALDPRFAGAFVGKNPMAKPENYGEHAVPLETFIRVVNEGIAEHNSREGRTSQTANGRSFDETFAESYAASPVPRATEEQRRLWMFGQHNGDLSKRDGSLRFQGNRYHSDWMSQIPGTAIVARFDPKDLHRGLEIYAKDGEYLGFAECEQAVGFFDMAGAKERARRVSRIKKHEKALAKLHAPIPMSEVVAKMDAAQPTPEMPLAQKVVPLPKPAAQSRIPTTTQQDPTIAAMAKADVLPLKPKPTTKSKLSESHVERFWRARDILERSQSGKTVGTEEARWVRAYAETAEYQGTLHLYETIGKEAVK